jgi:hypothetical protein
VSDEPDTDATSEGSAADAVIEALMSPRPSRQQAELDKAIFVATRLVGAFGGVSLRGGHCRGPGAAGGS